MNLVGEEDFQVQVFDSGVVIRADIFDYLPYLKEGGFALAVADPPYNVSKAGGRYGFRGKEFVDEEWDKIDDYFYFSHLWMDACKDALVDNGLLYVWGYHRSMPYMPIDKWYQLNMIVWHRRNAFPTTMQNSIWSPSCQYSYLLRKDSGKDHTMNIGRNDFARDFFNGVVINNKRHPTEKPLVIHHEFIRRSSNSGDRVLDLFSGSGTTAIACSLLDREFVAIEKEVEYFQKICDRLGNLDKEIELLEKQAKSFNVDLEKPTY